VTLIDPTTNCRYVLLREEVFERCRSLIGVEGFDPADFYAGQDKVAAIAWDHPDDAAYDNYNELTAK
jgi:hypothetical protein